MVAATVECHVTHFQHVFACILECMPQPSILAQAVGVIGGEQFAASSVQQPNLRIELASEPSGHHLHGQPLPGLHREAVIVP